MTVSTFDLFKIGIGPSSSHTVGPMVAARRFGEILETSGRLGATARVSVDLYGSLALTGKGHATDVAIILGLAGQVPATVDPDAVAGIVAGVTEARRVALLGRHDVAFDPAEDMRFLQRERQPYHSNAMALSAWDSEGELLMRRLYYSVGGGFVLDEDEVIRNAPAEDAPVLPYPFTSGNELVAIGEQTGLTIAQIMLANELAWRSPSEVDAGLDLLADTMAACIDRGCIEDGILPGGLKVRRRAAKLAKELQHRQQMSLSEPLAVLDWINLWAMAVNEENAAGGRVVTAPTNGAAGIIPAVLR